MRCSAFVFCLALVACGPLSPAASPHEAVQELNHHVRFGRTGPIADFVAPKERGPFEQRRRAWGRDLQIVDDELVALVRKGTDRCEATVRVSWYRPQEGELHVTDLRQNWEQRADRWVLVGEVRAGGAEGLFGDGAPFAPAREPPRDVHRPTVRIGPGVQ